MNQEELAAWMPLLQAEFQKPYWPRLCQAVEAAYDAGTVYPPRPALFRALRLTAPAAVRVVILGQDPYHTPGMADGLAFSVPSGAKLPPSLRNIYRELQEDLGLESAPESAAWPDGRAKASCCSTRCSPWPRAGPMPIRIWAGSASPTLSSPPAAGWSSLWRSSSGALRPRKKRRCVRPAPDRGSFYRPPIQALCRAFGAFSGVVPSPRSTGF